MTKEIINKWLQDSGIEVPEERIDMLVTMLMSQKREERKAYINKRIENTLEDERFRIKEDLEEFMWQNFDVDINNEEYLDIIWNRNE